MSHPGFILLDLTHYDLGKVAQQPAVLSIKAPLLTVNDAPAEDNNSWVQKAQTCCCVLHACMQHVHQDAVSRAGVCPHA